MLRHTISFFVAAVLSVAIAQNASAAIVGFGDFTQFQANATGTEMTIDFDSIAPGSSVGVIGDTTFQTSGSGLQVYATDGINDGTISPDNYVGNDFVLFPQLENEFITISFATPRSAAGIWVIYNGAPSPNFSLTATGGLGHLSSTLDPTVDLPGGARAHFLGFVEDTGANTIESISLQNPANGPSYFFDSQVSFIASPVAIPEPGSLAFLAAISGVVLVRRRRF